MSDKITFPLVSICIPTFNGQDYIHEAMTSAVDQTYPNLEIVVSDDQSSDDTVEIINSFKEKTNIPIHIYNHNPQGIGANWNHCVQKASGDFIKFLFQDDVLHPSCIELMMIMMLSDDQIGLVYSKREFIYKEVSQAIDEFVDFYADLHTYWEELSDLKGVVDGKRYLRDPQFLNAPKNKIGEPSNVLLRKICFEKIGFFSEKMQQALDSDFWYRLMPHYKIGFIDEVLSEFRLHDNQASVINKKRDIPDNDLIYRRYYKYLYRYLHPKNKWKLLKLYHPFFRALVKLKGKLHAG